MLGHIKGDKVIAVSPLAHLESIRWLIEDPDVLKIELTDSPEHIFDRLIFSDENDIPYKDDAYKKRYKSHYLKEIQADLDFYGRYSFFHIENRFDMDGRTPEEAVDHLIREYRLEPEK